jgi:outer membrane protein
VEVQLRSSWYAIKCLSASAIVLVAASWPQDCIAETLMSMLARVYQSNPQINAERARLRGIDEGVPQALSGYRPQVAVGLSAGLQSIKNLFPDSTTQSQQLRPWMAGITLTQPLFNGFKTGNSVRQAEAQVLSGRESLRNVEQTVFVGAVTAFMNVLADQTLVEAQRANVTFLKETLESTRTRLRVGDGTPTDVAQAEARFNRGVADLNAAEVALAIDQATYAQFVGAAPGKLAPPAPVDRLLPGARDEALAISRRENPTVVGATHDVDVAQAAIKIAESALMPNVSVQGGLSRSVETDTTFGTSRTDQASVIGQATVPLYDGGLAAAQVRQAKETLTQVRVVLDQTRVLNDTAVVTSWSTNEGAKTAISAGEAEVRAAGLALEGVQKEYQAGKRTLIEVLNANQDLMAARVRLLQAQRDRTVASFTLLGAIGRLDHKSLGLNTPDYEPQVHYSQVRDAWHGLRTPEGR